jgi:hypothetical protein
MLPIILHCMKNDIYTYTLFLEIQAERVQKHERWLSGSGWAAAPYVYVANQNGSCNSGTVLVSINRPLKLVYNVAVAEGSALGQIYRSHIQLFIHASIESFRLPRNQRISLLTVSILMFILHASP